MLLAPHERTKLTAQSVECVFLSYNVEHKGYNCWGPVARRMRTFRDVVFDETRPFYPRSSLDTSSSSLVDPLSFLFIPDAHPSITAAPRLVPSSVVRSSVSPLESSPAFPDFSTKPPVTQVYTRRVVIPPTEISSFDELDSSDEPSTPDAPSSPAALSPDISISQHDSSSDESSPKMTLRRGDRVRHAPDRYSPSSLVAAALPDPHSYRDDILNPEWQLAMAEEIAALERTGT